MGSGKPVVMTIACLWLGTACVPVALAPGADQVKMTKDPHDVASCKAMGNVKVPRNDQGNVDIANAQRQFRNQVIGLGGNTGLVTYGLVGAPVEGIAYQCS